MQNVFWVMWFNFHVNFHVIWTNLRSSRTTPSSKSGDGVLEDRVVSDTFWDKSTMLNVSWTFPENFVKIGPLCTELLTFLSEGLLFRTFTSGLNNSEISTHVPFVQSDHWIISDNQLGFLLWFFTYVSAAPLLFTPWRRQWAWQLIHRLHWHI